MAAILETGSLELRHSEVMAPLLEEPHRQALESYEEFFDRVLPRALSVGRRILGSREDAEDAAVEGLARAYVHWAELSSADYREAWALRVTANAAYDQLRRRIRAEKHEPEPAGARDVTEVVDLRRSLAPLLMRLSRRQREVVVLNYMVGLSQEEIAKLLGCSLGSVKVHAKRGLERLRTNRQSLEALSKEES